MALYKAALLDLGGVVYVGDQPLPGAVEAINRLRQAEMAIRFLTNTTRSSHRQILEKLRGMGLTIADEELFTPAMAARHLIEKDALTPHLLIHPNLEEDFTGLKAGQREALVLGDAGDGFTYPALNAAFRALQRDAKFLALANNRSFRDADGQLSLDAGPFVAALTFASRREPVVLGKPAAAFFHSALESLGCAPEDAVMIGDDVENDVAGGMAVGLAGILVRTGKYSPGAEDQIDPPPSTVADDLPAAADWILSGRKK